MGDGVIRVAGTLNSEAEAPLTDCKLQIIVPSSPQPSYYTVAIDPHGFREDFTVAPRGGTYPLIITCAGHKPYKDQVKRGKYAPPVRELGTITLKPLRSGT